ncbi:hypothetical protein HK098_005946 [Nowakowskiella sp. JEL0407]|nr:hypothetical protein HK098_005946 [Nowakowskiella sp. JEL0407]
MARKMLWPFATLPPSRVKLSIITPPVRRPGGVFSTPLVHLVGDGDVVEGASSVEFFDGVDSDAVARDCTKSVTIHSMVPGEGGRKGREWKAVVAKSTLFVKVPASIDWEESGFGFKESVVAVMELAENVLECSELVFCLQKSRPDLTLLIRAFMFVGFEIVHPTVYNFGEDYVLVGSEL